MTSNSDKARMSSQMEAVMRLMTGKEERTIAEKMADANRPTWEQYKKDNEDKLNLSGADQKKMEEYRKELDAERERKMAGRGSEKDTKSKKKKKKSKHSDESDGSNADDSGTEEERSKRKKHHKKKISKKHKKKRKHHRRRDDSDDSISSDSSSEEERRRRKKKRKKSKKRRDESDEEEDDRYKLSSFFTDKGDGGD